MWLRVGFQSSPFNHRQYVIYGYGVFISSIVNIILSSVWYIIMNIVYIVKLRNFQFRYKTIILIIKYSKMLINIKYNNDQTLRILYWFIRTICIAVTAHSLLNAKLLYDNTITIHKKMIFFFMKTSTLYLYARQNKHKLIIK